MAFVALVRLQVSARKLMLLVPDERSDRYANNVG